MERKHKEFRQGYLLYGMTVVAEFAPCLAEVLYADPLNSMDYLFSSNFLSPPRAVFHESIFLWHT